MDILVTQWGYWGIILFLVLTGCGLPIPEEFPIVLSGVLSSKGLMNPWYAYAACLIGAILGDSVMYAIGYHWGHDLLKSHPRLGKWLHAEREETFERAITRHGLKVMILARFMVGIRSPAYLASGVIRIPYRRFLAMDLVAATLVVTLFFGLSYTFGEHITRFIREAEYALTIAVVIFVIGGIIVWRRRRPLARVLLKPEADEAAKTSIDEEDHTEGHSKVDLAANAKECQQSLQEGNRCSPEIKVPAESHVREQ